MCINETLDIKRRRLGRVMRRRQREVALELRPTVLKPELYVLGLQFGKLLTVS